MNVKKRMSETITGIYKFITKLIKQIPFILKIKNKIYPSHIQNTFENFKTLAVRYNQFSSMKKWSCLDKSGNPIPWYTYPTIEYLQNLDFSDKNVFEYGSGNSSLWWAKRCRKITSIESDAKWFNQIKALQLVVNNFDYQLEINEKKYAEQSAILGSDVIIIDGLCRVECADFVIDQIEVGKVNPNMLIFDNSDWYPETIFKLNQRLKDWVQVDFSGFGPINGYTWTTSIFINTKSNSKLNYKTALSSIAGLRQVFG